MATAAAQPVELADYWAEFNNACRFDDDTQTYEEGELEAEWLRAAGLGALAAPFAAGREVGAAQLEATLARLPAERASAVRRRVARLNRTLRRQRGRVTRKPDIRDVFTDTESPPYRSRSATPDSLDSAPSGGSSSPPSEWADPPPPNLFENYGPGTKHAALCRAPSAPPGAGTPGGAGSPPAASPPRPGHELFKHSDLHWADVASNSEGIELLGYQRFGTVQGPRLGKERINKTILQDPIILSGKHLSVSRTHSAAADTHPQNDQLLSFQHKFSSDFEISTCTEEWPEQDTNTHVDEISEAQMKKLIPFLWLDLAALFDKYNIAFRKRKPAKKKKKEENNVFGVSLLALLRKDYIICEDTSSMVPRAIRCLTQALHGHITEEGIFRLTGNKQKIENLCNIMERYFYEDTPLVEQTIAHSACHDIVTTLKRFLRDLPQTLLTTELVQLFYQTSTLSGGVQGRALNLLVLLLPTEHRAALLHILQLMNDIASHHVENKMTLHNIAMIMAPTFFPPNLVIKPTDTLDMQLQVAANSCRVTEALMRLESKLWFVPYSLMVAIERKNGHRRRVYRNSNTET